MKYVKTFFALVSVFLLILCSVVFKINMGKETENWESKTRADNRGQFHATRASTLGIIEFLATGAKPFFADLYWIKATTLKADEIFEITKKYAMQGKEVGTALSLELEVPMDATDNRDLYDILSNTTYLDPTFEYAYFFGSQLLSWNGDTTLATALLERGIHSNIRSGMLASSLSFIYYYFYKDWDMGAYYAKLSYQYSGKYSSTPKEITNLYAAGRHYDMAIKFMSDTMENTKDPDAKEQMEEQLKYLFVEKYIDYLEEGCRRYKQATGRFPATLSDLVKTRIINAVPEDPFGGKFVIVANGKVENKPYRRNTHYIEIRNRENSLSEEEGKRVE